MLCTGRSTINNAMQAAAAFNTTVRTDSGIIVCPPVLLCLARGDFKNTPPHPSPENLEIIAVKDGNYFCCRPRVRGWPINAQQASKQERVFVKVIGIIVSVRQALHGDGICCGNRRFPLDTENSTGAHPVHGFSHEVQGKTRAWSRAAKTENNVGKNRKGHITR